MPYKILACASVCSFGSNIYGTGITSSPMAKRAEYTFLFRSYLDIDFGAVNGNAKSSTIKENIMEIIHDLLHIIIEHTYLIETYNEDDREFAYPNFTKEQIEYHLNALAQNGYILLKHKRGRKTNNGNLPYALTDDKGKILSDFKQAEPYMNQIKKEYEKSGNFTFENWEKIYIRIRDSAISS